MPSASASNVSLSANTGRLGIGVGEHKMIDHMRKSCSCNGDSQILHVREIRLSTCCWGLVLFKNDVFVRSVQGSPSGNMPSQRAGLSRTIATWLLLAQQGKER